MRTGTREWKSTQKTLVAQMQVLGGTGRETDCIQCNNVPMGKAY